MRMLPVAFAGGPNRLLVDEIGHPIWPASTPREFDLLASTADRVSSGVRMARSHDSDPEHLEHGSGSVACVERSVRSEGQLYAHLTGRKFISLDDPQRLAGIEDLEAVVCSADAVSSAMLHRMYDPGRAVSPGLVYGRTPADIRAQVLRASALARLGARAEGIYVQISPDLGTGSAEERMWVTSAVALDASVLAVLTHSDALDAPLAKGLEQGNLLICPIRNALDVAPQRTPECRHSGWCHRLRMSVEEAFARGELIEPQAFRARILVWSTCFGAIDGGAPLDRQWSVVHQLNINPSVDVVLAKWRGAFGHGPFNEMVQSLSIGVSVGQAVAAFNATEGMLERGAQFAIFGDPRLAAPFSRLNPGMETFYMSPQPTAEGSSDKTTVSVADGAGRECELIALLQDCIRTPLRFSDEEREAEAARVRFEQALSAHRRDCTSLLCLAELQNTALECLQRYADVVRGWSPRVTAQTFAIGRPCAHCGELRSEAINVFARPLGPRRIGTCPKCQLVEDSPAEYDLDFRVTEDRQLELIGSIPSGRFSGLVVLWSTVPMAGTVRHWPVADNGRPLRQFAFDVEWPRAPTRVTVWMMFNLQYLTLNHRVQGVTNPPAHP